MDLVCDQWFSEPWYGGHCGVLLRAQASVAVGWLSSHKKLLSSPGVTRLQGQGLTAMLCLELHPAPIFRSCGWVWQPLAKLPFPIWLILTRTTWAFLVPPPNVCHICCWMIPWRLCIRSFPQEGLSSSKDPDGDRHLGNWGATPEAGSTWSPVLAQAKTSMSLYPSDMFVVACKVYRFMSSFWEGFYSRLLALPLGFLEMNF